MNRRPRCRPPARERIAACAGSRDPVQRIASHVLEDTMQPEPILDLAHLGHMELLTPKPDESLKFFVDVHGHDGQRPKGRVGLSARLGRLRALFAQTDGVEDVGHGAHGVARAQPAGAGAPRRRAEGIRLRHRLDRRRHGAGAGLPLPRSRRPHHRALLRDRMVPGAARAEARPEEPGAALSRRAASMSAASTISIASPSTSRPTASSSRTISAAG